MSPLSSGFTRKQRSKLLAHHAKGEAEFYLVGLEANDGGVRLDGDEDLWLINDV